jgi:very-short-patch-repair endonuclease
LRTPRDPQGIDRAKRLRRDMTPPERAMWRILRGHRLEGWKFTRQISEGPFTIDFAARRERLANELDGDTHAEQEDYDQRRTAYLGRAGWTVIRFSNRDILGNPEGVALKVTAALEKITPSPRRGEATKA